MYVISTLQFSSLTPANVKEESFIRTSHFGEQVASAIRPVTKSGDKTAWKHGRSPSPPRSPPRQCRCGSGFGNPLRGVVNEDIALQLLEGFKNLAQTIGELQTRVKELRVMAFSRLHR